MTGCKKDLPQFFQLKMIVMTGSKKKETLNFFLKNDSNASVQKKTPQIFFKMTGSKKKIPQIFFKMTVMTGSKKKKRHLKFFSK